MIIYPLGVVGVWQVVIIALVVILLFGGKKIPELMKGLGKGVKSFREGLQEVDDQINGTVTRNTDENLTKDATDTKKGE